MGKRKRFICWETIIEKPGDLFSGYPQIGTGWPYRLPVEPAKSDPKMRWAKSQNGASILTKVRKKPGARNRRLAGRTYSPAILIFHKNRPCPEY
jgi:hypothetical protein